VKRPRSDGSAIIKVDSKPLNSKPTDFSITNITDPAINPMPEPIAKSKTLSKRSTDLILRIEVNFGTAG